MSDRKWEKAQPYAEAAAETWAAWAMQCAVRCYEGLKDWERAELWVRRLSERYPTNSVGKWLDFCKRTGHGDVRLAQALVDQYRVAVGQAAVQAAEADRADPDDPLAVGLSAWLKGAPKEAIGHLRKAYASRSPLLAGFALAVLADDLGDPAG